MQRLQAAPKVLPAGIWLSWLLIPTQGWEMGSATRVIPGVVGLCCLIGADMYRALSCTVMPTPFPFSELGWWTPWFPAHLCHERIGMHAHGGRGERDSHWNGHCLDDARVLQLHERAAASGHSCLATGATLASPRP